MPLPTGSTSRSIGAWDRYIALLEIRRATIEETLRRCTSSGCFDAARLGFVVDAAPMDCRRDRVCVRKNFRHAESDSTIWTLGPWIRYGLMHSGTTAIFAMISRTFTSAHGDPTGASATGRQLPQCCTHVQPVLVSPLLATASCASVPLCIHVLFRRASERREAGLERL